MNSSISLQEVAVHTGSDDRTGNLVFYDRALAAVLVRLDGKEHGDNRGSWFLELGFGPLASCREIFASLSEAERWIGDHLMEARSFDTSFRRHA